MKKPANDRRPNGDPPEVGREGGTGRMLGRTARTRLRDETLRWGCDALAMLLILAALTVALTKTSGLTAPHDWDHFRDIAQARTVRDGAPLSDQYYRGEWVWYNPLLAWMLALGSALAGTTIELFHVQSGPWLNLLGPLALYPLGVKLVGRTAAFIALALYLFFMIGDGPGWAYATYSPWLFSNDFAEGFFFAAALALQRASERATLPRAVCAGVMMGLTFLAHTGPALILVVIAFAVLAARWRVFLTTGLVAFFVASPFLYSIGMQYHFHAVHTTPLSWVWTEALTPAALPQFLRDNAILIGLAAFGVVLAPSRLLLVWFLVAATLLLYATLSETPFIPAFHWWKWATAAMALLAGTTLAWLCSTTEARPWEAIRRSSLPPGPHRPNPVAVSLTVAAVVWYWPAYMDRSDFREARERDRSQVNALKFLRETTERDAVVLGNDDAVLYIIGPAGRKTVAPHSYFANPYVAYGPRVRDRERMLAAIETGNMRTFYDLARKHGVTTVVSLGSDACAAAFRVLPPRARFGDVCISGSVLRRLRESPRPHGSRFGIDPLPVDVDGTLVSDHLLVESLFQLAESPLTVLGLGLRISSSVSASADSTTSATGRMTCRSDVKPSVRSERVSRSSGAGCPQGGR